ncbi:hypothetical protein Pmar_PMAR002881 [Perkinsus marinus ATCC 50983]|uniref:Uncharacterized protein n=1 Tax=Perkinsus marinus (strain ATCC 50983 / TXsc) TaxID=423536 RepID=C5LQS9_PERM5|nr:hypothetical protein Pmar_PMAR002881 [Perkinsus marinus ATCC 50983]EER00814.1 hypothetical protein Pmar_PMAR002881 [Perkinsus marinus ATCC 50983]|eukprot:XP_002768096.1 hypothetical protein Pmar_PMAR002881 [Perkinsus marinus ATCC 50983]
MPSGVGQVLHALCNKVLMETGFRFVHPDFTVLDQGESQADFETGGDELEEEFEDVVSDGHDDDAANFGAAQSKPSRGNSFPGGLLPEEKHIVKSTVKPEDWRVECERVSGDDDDNT